MWRQDDTESIVALRNIKDPSSSARWIYLKSIVPSDHGSIVALWRSNNPFSIARCVYLDDDDWIVAPRRQRYHNSIARCSLRKYRINYRCDNHGSIVALKRINNPFSIPRCVYLQSILLRRCCQGMMITNHSCTVKEAMLPSQSPVVLLCRQGAKDLNQLLWTGDCERPQLNRSLQEHEIVAAL